MTTFVLVHGAMHGSWCWEGVAKPLRDKGHHVEAVDLPGRPGGPQLAGPDLASYAATVIAAIDCCAEPVVLVAHSLGGLAATLAAEARAGALARTVFVNSLILRDGEGALQTILAPESESFFTREGSLTISSDGASIFVSSPEAAVEGFYHRCAPADATNAAAQLVPEPLPPVLEIVKVTGSRFGSVPKTYIGSRHDRAVPWQLQLDMSDRAGADFIELDADHSPFMSAPNDLIAALAGL
ncbi:esterase EstC [Mycobacterium lentiflavum]|uniref:Esterase EstC n=1 Tax=Mycobacterium lentiflavum TaxID=141349 RepID=A0A0E4H2P2_MYCLN|nr:alpha/beta fold hydrolase [Mycobacterium lentiflavum]CQD17853.1 esterase EstC [Mycobacterium lentiflavum]